MLIQKNKGFALLFLLVICFFSCFSLSMAAEASTTSQFAGSKQSSISGEVIKKLQAEALKPLEDKKANLKPAQEKLSTDLLQLINVEFLLPGQSREDVKRQMQSLKQFLPAGAVERAGNGKAGSDLVYVYIYLKPSSTTRIIDSLAWKITDRSEENHLVATWVEVKNLETVASLDEVRAIRTVIPPRTGAGSVTSEGDAIHRADLVRALYGQDGSGVKVGVISDGVDHWTQARNSGDLPANLTVLSNTRGGDEGTAMLEIVHDLAPGAQLYFHDCGSNRLAFNSAIDNLMAAGCKVICDDIGWIAEPFFEDGIIAQHVASKLKGNNVVYVSSAGNAGGRHYQGRYHNDGYNFHDQYLYIDIPRGGSVSIILQWNDKFGASGNDYDLILADLITGEIVDYSIQVQDGKGDPLEIIMGTNVGNSTINGVILVGNYQDEAASKTLEAYIYPDQGTWVYSNNITAQDSIFGHPAVPGVISSGAINVQNPSQIAAYSSRGPVTISYPSEELRAKPDVCGMDGVKVTGAGGFPTPFYGTSAAAPHVAAVAALAWAQSPGKTAKEIRDTLLTTAVDLGSTGFDYIYGYGRADALNAFPPIAGEGAVHGIVTLPYKLRPDAENPANKDYSGVEVTLEDAKGVVKTATTDQNGSYSFTKVPEGTYKVVAKKYGYLTQEFINAQGSALIRVTAGSDIEASLTLPYGEFGDGQVINITDISKIAMQFNKAEGWEGYDLILDWSRDGRINITDISAAARSFNKRYAPQPWV